MFVFHWAGGGTEQGWVTGLPVGACSELARASAALGEVDSGFPSLRLRFKLQSLIIVSVGLGSGSRGGKGSFNYSVTSVNSLVALGSERLGKVCFWPLQTCPPGRGSL